MLTGRRALPAECSSWNALKAGFGIELTVMSPCDPQIVLV
jgi:hypothetical protein